MQNKQIVEELGQLQLRQQEIILAGKVRFCDPSVIPFTNY